MAVNIGVVGLVLLALGWLAQAIRTIREKRIPELDRKFIIIYLFGSLFLVAYAIQINDRVFIILNAAVVLLNLITLMFALQRKEESIYSRLKKVPTGMTVKRLVRKKKR